MVLPVFLAARASAGPGTQPAHCLSDLHGGRFASLRSSASSRARRSGGPSPPCSTVLPRP